MLARDVQRHDVGEVLAIERIALEHAVEAVAAADHHRQGLAGLAARLVRDRLDLACRRSGLAGRDGLLERRFRDREVGGRRGDGPGIVDHGRREAAGRGLRRALIREDQADADQGHPDAGDEP